MAQLYDIMKQQSKYWDKKNFITQQAYKQALSTSSTLYVGNLSFYIEQDSIKQLFSRAGNISNIIMGLDNEGTPCGFCFVVMQTRKQAELAVQYLTKTKLGGRIIRVDHDPGYIEGRQKGRGQSGLQKRDDFRTKEDPDRPRKKVNNQYHGNTYRDNRQPQDQRNFQRRDRPDYKPRQNRDGRWESNRQHRNDDRGQSRQHRGQYKQRNNYRDQRDRQPRESQSRYPPSQVAPPQIKKDEEY